MPRRSADTSTFRPRLGLVSATRPPAYDPPLARTKLFAPATRQVPAKLCVIAEIGVNHDGQRHCALELVSAAARTGVHAVKFQLFDPRHLLSNQAAMANYQKENLGRNQPDANNAEEDNPFDMLKSLALSFDDLLAVKQRCRDEGVAFILTPFSLENFEELKALNPDAVKIASPDAVNAPLLEQVASLEKPLVISTGTCELEELRFAAELIRRHEAGGVLMHCVSAYPTPLEDASLGAIRAIANRYSLPVGYSDHTTDVTMGGLAVSAGACVIEKHLTWSRAAKGPDHAASMEPKQMSMYTLISRQAARIVGPVSKHVRRVEADVRKVSRQSVCLKRDLPAGHVLDRADLTVKRPGTGIPAARLNDCVGLRLAKPVNANDLLSDADVVLNKEVA